MIINLEWTTKILAEQETDEDFDMTSASKIIDDESDMGDRIWRTMKKRLCFRNKYWTFKRSF